MDKVLGNPYQIGEKYKLDQADQNPEYVLDDTDQVYKINPKHLPFLLSYSFVLENKIKN
jgi:hypothetical protein